MGSTSDLDQAQAVTVGASGNIYTTGEYGYNADLDPGPGVYTLPSSSTIYINKLSASGNFIWAKPLGNFFNNSGFAITIDQDENIYVAGDHNASGDFDPGPGVAWLDVPGGTGGFVCKFDSAGNLIWARMLASPSTGTVHQEEIRLDTNGNVFVVGRFTQTVDFDPGTGTYLLTEIPGNPGQVDAFICKLSNAGNFIWARSFGSPDYDTATSVALDVEGNAYVVGFVWFYALTSQGYKDILIRKYDPTGTLLWSNQYGGAGADEALDVGIDGAGDLYVVGNFGNSMTIGSTTLTSAGLEDAFLLKFNGAGTCLWGGSMGGTGTDFGNCIATDSAGNSWVFGDFSGTADFDPGMGTATLSTSQPMSYYCAKYDANRHYQWSGAFGGGGLNGSRDNAIDLAGNVVHVGYTVGTRDYDPGPGVFHLITPPLYEDIYVQKIAGCPTTPAPTNTTPLPNLAICAGQTTTLTTTGLGTLRWFAQPSGGSPIANGGSFTTPNLAVTTTFYVQDSLCAVSQRTAITVTVAPSSSSAFAATACGSYIGPSGQVWTLSGSYLDTLVNSVGCDSFITVNLTVLPTSASTISPIVCDSFISPSGNYVWNQSGTYFDTIPNFWGCDSLMTILLTLAPLTLGVTNNSPTLVAQALGASYQWIYCDSAIIAGQTNMQFTATSSGNYAVIVTNNGCSDTSACIGVTVTTMREALTDQRIILYPNPTAGLFEIEIGGYLGETEVVVANALGQIVQQRVFETAERIAWELEGDHGIYFVAVHLGNGHRALVKVIKQ